jgi:hypothetical protein
MNRHFAFALVIAAASIGNAFADDITIDPTPFTSTMSRAQVLDELQAFRSSGVNPWADSHDQLAGFRSERTRAEVSAEYIAGREQVLADNGEDGGSMRLARREQPQPATSLAAVSGQAD